MSSPTRFRSTSIASKTTARHCSCNNSKDSLLFSFPTSGNTGYQDVFPSQKQPEAIEASTISGASGVAEGTEYTLNLQSSDTRPTPTSWEITWGDGEVEELDGNPTSATHTYPDGANTFSIVAKTTDDDGILTPIHAEFRLGHRPRRGHHQRL